MNKQIILASLRARPVRTGISVLAVALEVTLILVIVGLASGMLSEQGRRITGIGADIMLQPPGSGMIVGMGDANMPRTYGSLISGVDGVAAVSPIVVQTNTGGPALEMIWGIDPATFDQVSGGLEYFSGGVFTNPNEVVVDDWYATSRNVKVGSTIVLRSETFTVTGVRRNGKGARLLISIDKAEKMSGKDGLVTAFLIKLRDPKEIDAISKRLTDENTGVLPTTIARNMAEYMSQLVPDKIPMLSEFIKAVVFVAVAIGVLVIFLSMYMTIAERTREIGILRSLGASRGFIVRLIVQESVLLCGLGIVAGFGCSFAIARIAKMISATTVIDITPGWLALAAMFAVLSGVLGSLYPAFKAATADPVEALAYE